MSYENFYSHEQINEQKVREATRYLSQALDRLKKNSNFNKYYGDANIGDFLPLIIKESRLINNKKSSSGAIGYFQLKSDAIEDAKQELRKLGISKFYNPENPEDNCILGIIYFLHNKNLIKNKLKGYNYDSEFELMAYNGGPKRVKSIIDVYKKENPNIGNNLKWGPFAKWLVGKLEYSSPTQSFSEEYNIYYKNYFSKDWSLDNTEIIFSGIKTKKGKIYEMINYVEKINAIKSTNQEKLKNKEKGKIKGQTQSQLQRLGLVINYNKELDSFNGDGFFDESWYNFKKFIKYNSFYIQIKALNGDGAIKILERAGINPSEENLKKFYDLNDLENDDGIKADKYYLMPNIKSRLIKSKKGEGVGKILERAGINPSEENIDKFYQINNLKSGSIIEIGKYYLLPAGKEDKNITGENREILLEKKPDFYKWLNSIEVKNNTLKGKLFILDPGHGGADPGAIPIAKDEKGRAIPYKQSDISESDKVTKNGKGDGKLHIVEARVVMDVSYRLAKLIKENGGEVKITHYFQNGIDNSVWTKSSLYSAQGLLDPIQNHDTWGDNTKKRFNEKSIEGLKKRVEIRNKFKIGKKKKNIYFLSIHADNQSYKDAIGINILHSKRNTGQRNFAKVLSENIGEIRNMKTTFSTRTTGIFVLNPIYGAHSQNVLIELGNMNNENTTYALRNSETRQEYAEGIFKGLLKTCSSSQ
ncbi:transglycosylase SLT domain-containing protein [Candidatus Gracilibacteria bacterium]|nr:transglycosylase SLT domain-containing protein [Candidatus Gracilibacteria bacterium]NUJ99164.1 transglycosylase SLT domain-containing protein [Candidatus Gracilibacteria bacterium]